MLKICEICGKEYNGTKQSRVCNDIHYVPCSVCGIDTPLNDKHKRFNYLKGLKTVCSDVCRSKLGGMVYSEKHKGKPIERVYNRICEICGDAFSGGPKRIICDKEHYAPCIVCGGDALIDSIRKWRRVAAGIGITCSPKCVESLRIKNLHSEESRKKATKTFYEKYGGSTALSSDVVRKKAHESFMEKSGGKSRRLIEETNKKYPKMTRREMSIYTGLAYSVIQAMAQKYSISIPYSTTSFLENEIKIFIDSLGVEYERFNKSILKDKKEIDFYFPKYNFGIEVNDVGSHNSTKGYRRKGSKSKHYHKNKTQEAKNVGIQLLHVWEWQIADPTQFEIIKSLIRNRLNLTEKRIFARKCRIVDIDRKIAKDFIERCHIQGYERCREAKALVYNDEVTMVMCFNNNELTRFCSELNTIVVGGFSKLFNAFNKNNVFTYSFNDYSGGELYLINGFALDGEIEPRYWWVKPRTLDVLKRRACQKEAIGKRWPDYYDYNDKTDTRTEVQLMTGKGYVQVFDSGKKRWLWTKKD